MNVALEIVVGLEFGEQLTAGHLIGVVREIFLAVVFEGQDSLQFRVEVQLIAFDG